MQQYFLIFLLARSPLQSFLININNYYKLKPLENWTSGVPIFLQFQDQTWGITISQLISFQAYDKVKSKEICFINIISFLWDHKSQDISIYLFPYNDYDDAMLWHNCAQFLCPFSEKNYSILVGFYGAAVDDADIISAQRFHNKILVVQLEHFFLLQNYWIQ